ncbi:MAG: rhodanese-related sulfurtransferase [Pseudomonadota bacterium]
MVEPSNENAPWQIAALYNFVALPDHEALRAPLRDAAQAHGLCGTLLIAPEGINGTIAGVGDRLSAFLTWLQALTHHGERPFDRLELKKSEAEEKPFARMKVRLKREIVTMGVEGIDPRHTVGTYVEPQDWNALIDRPDVTVVDTRNDYEVAIGTFDGAVDPKTSAFGEFPDWAQDNLPADKQAPIAMFCTGGIRCEKSTALLKSRGYENVFHLKGGILKYLEDVPEEDSRWQGECFVFDQRVSVGHGLIEGPHTLCHACGLPLTPADLSRPEYEAGVSCHNCMTRYSDADRARFRERQRQRSLAIPD